MAEFVVGPGSATWDGAAGGSGAAGGAGASGCIDAAAEPTGVDGTTRRSPDIDRNVMSGPPEPTSSVRRPRPPSERPPTRETRSPLRVAISIRTSPAGARSRSPLTVTMANGPGAANRPAIRMSPLVVVMSIELRVAARSATSPETVRRVTAAPPVATRSTSPETASTAIRPLTARRRMSPDTVR